MYFCLSQAASEDCDPPETSLQDVLSLTSCEAGVCLKNKQNYTHWPCTSVHRNLSFIILGENLPFC